MTNTHQFPGLPLGLINAEGVPASAVILTPATSARNVIQPTADAVPLTIQGFAGALSNLLLVEKSDASVFMQLDANANLTLQSASAPIFDVLITTTNFVQNALVLNAQASGITPAVGYGLRLLLEGNSDTVPARSLASIVAAWTTVTDASRAAKLIFNVYNTAAVNVLTLTPTAMILNSGTLIEPTANSTSAFQFANAAGTAFLTLDSGNHRLRIGDATVPGFPLEVVLSDSGTTNAPVAFNLIHLSSGTPSTNFGVAMTFQAHTSANAVALMGRIDTAWTTATDGAQVAAMHFGVNNIGSTVTIFTLNPASPHLVFTDARDISFGGSTGTKIGTATNQKFAFWNATPIAQPTSGTAIDTALANLGLRGSGGTANFASLMSVVDTDAGTTTQPNVLALQHLSSGTPAANFGVTLLFQAHTSTNTLRSQGAIITQWSTATDGSELSTMQFSVYNLTTVTPIFTLNPATPHMTFTDARDISFGTTTGTKIGTATTQKIGFYGATPIAQRSGAAQAAAAATSSTQVTPFGYTTQAQADAIVTLVNELRAWAVAQGFIKGSA